MTFRRFEPLLPKELEITCAYCGVLATTRDHYLPWSEFRRPFWVPACQICNTLLGNELHTTWFGRCAHLGLLYRVRYRSLAADYDSMIEHTNLPHAQKQVLRHEQMLQEMLDARLERLLAWTKQDKAFPLDRLVPGSDLLVEFMTAHALVLPKEPRACRLEL